MDVRRITQDARLDLGDCRPHGIRIKEITRDARDATREVGLDATPR